MRRRITWLWTCIATAFAALLGRLFVLAFLPDGFHAGAIRWQDHLRTRALLEHLRGVVTDDARGRIRFDNGLPVTGRRVRRSMEAGRANISFVVHTERAAGPAAAGSARRVAGTVGLPDTWPDPARVVEEQGRSGLEARFDRVLRGDRPGFVGVTVLASEQAPPIAGAQTVRVQPAPGADVRTTLRPAWQRAADDALRDAGIREGAAVVLDVANNHLLAMADVSPDPAALPAVTAETPGSVMKLVTAAAGLESFQFAPWSRFVCKGRSLLEGVNMRCWRVHGPETLTEALATSCDVALAEVGARLGRAGLSTAWRQLHLDSSQLQRTDGKPVLAEAQAGQLFRRSGRDNGLLANTAIGQEDVRITPLQAANLARTIATLGQYSDVQLVQDVERRGRVIRWFGPTGSARALSPLTAQALGDAMRRAVTSPDGTAHDLAGADVSVAAKTGTAQLPDGRDNGWLIGYAPFDHPQVAFCVFVADVDAQSAHDQVHRAVQSLLRAYRQFPPPSVIR
ncbi:MAG: hypothetical protein K6T78_02540 [Alicyclobacillus sp.]|nr:hypothetical protein [Alicyclobacillus sp.]